MKIVDANVSLTYAIDFDARGEDGQIVRVRRHNREAAVAAVDGAAESGTLRIPDVAAAEVCRVAEGAVESAARSANAPHYAREEVVKAVLEISESLHERFRIKDRKDHTGRVGGMYKAAWDDPRMANAIGAWRRVKEKRGKKAARPTLEENEGDYLILSTAAYWAERGVAVYLLTFDHDFVEFAGMILDVFGVRVVDLGRRHT